MVEAEKEEIMGQCAKMLEDIVSQLETVSVEE
jgi:hypothetical protein